MKVIIAGSRHLTGAEADRLVGLAVVSSGLHPDMTQVVSGAAKGIDEAGERWAKWTGITVARFPADWTKFGKSAGPRRNRQMAEFADALIAVPHPTLDSRGTRDMIAAMKALGKKVYVYEEKP